MLKQELIELCQKYIDTYSNKSPEITLELKGRITKSGYKPIAGVKGECVQEVEGNSVLCIFPALNLKTALEKLPDDTNIKCSVYRPQVIFDIIPRNDY
jgi:hypothetical protein